MVVAPERSWVPWGRGAEPRSEREAGGDGDVVGGGGGVRTPPTFVKGLGSGWKRANERGS